MKVLVITEEHRQRIAAVRAFAAENVITFKEVWRLKSGAGMPPGDDARRNVELPVGFRVAHSIDETEQGLCAHLSVSVDQPGGLPSPQAVEMLLVEFGMPPLMECKVWPHDIAHGHQCINVAAPYRGSGNNPLVRSEGCGPSEG